MIVREYRIQQKIPFHFDDLECSELVVGIILLNEDEQQRGLSFQRGENDKLTQYDVKERPGTVFSLTGESRYKVWAVVESRVFSI